ncbi:hypothetical protein [Acetivibrio ethanolgignens]|uniref:Uncharacterized protein n=1 Tax=Acetivibrio ethanolgignens TaxID=290052 RepID=A0A0V8QGE6_9FIRM|nr:hypothetical protein [Acetivibrio ethanolgignens]KSV59161.1 hypothetical protein ASU35_10415 [Acetivibrio ethanolgignens]
MVKRSAFGIEGNNTIVQLVTEIEWNLGFSREAKAVYAQRIQEALHERVLDVTTASPEPRGFALSPHVLEAYDSKGQTVMEFVQEMEDLCGPSSLQNGLVFCYVYCRSIRDTSAIDEYKWFSDVFHNPDKGYTNTQAFSAAVLKLMKEHGELKRLDSFQDFKQWWQSLQVVTKERGIANE